jgi:hypothetical protein
MGKNKSPTQKHMINIFQTKKNIQLCKFKKLNYKGKMCTHIGYFNKIIGKSKHLEALASN